MTSSLLIPPEVDLPTEQKKVRRRSLIAFLVCAPTLLASTLGLPALVRFPTDLAARLAVALRADLLIVLWVVIAVRMVAKARFESKADSAGSAFAPPSPRLAVPAAFLQNTLEQAFTAVVGHLALATISGAVPLAYIIGAVALFSVGRMAFLLGYPHGAGGRAFGVATTAIPTVGAYVWVISATAIDLSRLTHRTPPS
jgi:MAPEG family